MGPVPIYFMAGSLRSSMKASSIVFLSISWKYTLAPVLAAYNWPKKYKFPPAWTPANMTAKIAVYRSCTLMISFLIITDPIRNMTAKVHEISVWPIPNSIPERFPYLMEALRASSSYFPYLAQILSSKWQLLTVLKYITDVITNSWFFLWISSVLLCMPWLNDIIILLDNKINGIISRDTPVICQLYTKAIPKPTTSVIKFSMIMGRKFPANGFKSSQLLFIMYE